MDSNRITVSEEIADTLVRVIEFDDPMLFHTMRKAALNGIAKTLGMNAEEIADRIGTQDRREYCDIAAPFIHDAFYEQLPNVVTTRILVSLVDLESNEIWRNVADQLIPTGYGYMLDVMEEYGIA